MPRDKRAEHLARLHRERRARAAGRFARTWATASGDVPAGPQPRDEGRLLLALVLLSLITLLLLGGLLYALHSGEASAWVHLVVHALGLDRSGMLLPPAHAR